VNSEVTGEQTTRNYELFGCGEQGRTSSRARKSRKQRPGVAETPPTSDVIPVLYLMGNGAFERYLFLETEIIRSPRRSRRSMVYVICSPSSMTRNAECCIRNLRKFCGAHTSLPTKPERSTSNTTLLLLTPHTALLTPFSPSTLVFPGFSPKRLAFRSLHADYRKPTPNQGRRPERADCARTEGRPRAVSLSKPIQSTFRDGVLQAAQHI
jgi:hypothetical protein